LNDLVTDREIYDRVIYERVICESVPMATIFSLVGNRRLKRHVRAQSAAHGAIFGDARRPH